MTETRDTHIGVQHWLMFALLMAAMCYLFMQLGEQRAPYAAGAGIYQVALLDDDILLAKDREPGFNVWSRHDQKLLHRMGESSSQMSGHSPWPTAGSYTATLHDNQHMIGVDVRNKETLLSLPNQQSYRSLFALSDNSGGVALSRTGELLVLNREAQIESRYPVDAVASSGRRHGLMTDIGPNAVMIFSSRSKRVYYYAGGNDEVRFVATSERKPEPKWGHDGSMLLQNKAGVTVVTSDSVVDIETPRGLGAQVEVLSVSNNAVVFTSSIGLVAVHAQSGDELLRVDPATTLDRLEPVAGKTTCKFGIAPKANFVAIDCLRDSKRQFGLFDVGKDSVGVLKTRRGKKPRLASHIAVSNQGEVIAVSARSMDRYAPGHSRAQPFRHADFPRETYSRSRWAYCIFVLLVVGVIAVSFAQAASDGRDVNAGAISSVLKGFMVIVGLAFIAFGLFGNWIMGNENNNSGIMGPGLFLAFAGIILLAVLAKILTVLSVVAALLIGIAKHLRLSAGWGMVLVCTTLASLLLLVPAVLSLSTP